MYRKLFCLLLALLLSLLSLAAQANCGASFCSVNTDWTAQGVWTENDGKFDLRYEFINQDQLRAGSSKTNAKQILDSEDEIKTRSHNLLAKYDYDFDSTWGLSFSLPIVNREHTHNFNAPSGAEVESWNFSKIGDAQILGRYKLQADNKILPGRAGLIAGFSLPTGQTNVTNNQGQLAERTLQPGSGATQLIVGGTYRFKVPGASAAWFSQLLIQAPLNEKNNFKPGKQINLDLGYLHQISDTYGAMVQLNYDYKGRDSGSNSEPDNSGSRILSISPGLSVFLGRDWQVYGFVQKPLSQHVNGVQLTSDWALVFGASTKF
jgi:hypothetical protein